LWFNKCGHTEPEIFGKLLTTQKDHKMIRKSPRHYTEEFKKEAVKLVLEHGYTQNAAAESLGIPGKNVNRWVRETREGVTAAQKVILSAEEKEICELRKEVQCLKMEKEILKKAAAFFAKELS